MRGGAVEVENAVGVRAFVRVARSFWYGSVRGSEVG